jgi:hypothetical protein
VFGLATDIAFGDRQPELNAITGDAHVLAALRGVQELKEQAAGFGSRSLDHVYSVQCAQLVGKVQQGGVEAIQSAGGDRAVAGVGTGV